MPFFGKTELAMIRPMGNESSAAQCGACGLYKNCNTPKMPVRGKGKRKILIVSKMPGPSEDATGRYGNSGIKLQQCLARLNVNMEEDCWLTYSLICMPAAGIPDDEKRIDYCRPNLLKAIKQLQPEVIILLDESAITSLIKWLWKDKDIGGINRWAGFQIPSQKINAWVCPTFHPSYLLRMNDKTLDLEFMRHLSAAVRLKGRPWPDGPPDYAKQVEIIQSPRAAAVALRDFAGVPRPIAFDYETTTKKPESPHARIVSCSFSDGTTTLAFPWHGPAIIEAMKLITDARYPKIVSNLDFENRWTRRIMKVPVRGWGWDTMNSAHVLDSRGGITGIKFQSFVRLGQPSYDGHIEPYLRTKGDNVKNRIHEVDLPSLLLYNGLDSLLEWLVAMDQRSQFGIKEEWTC